MTCEDGSPRVNGACAVSPKAPAPEAPPVCNDGIFDVREDCEIGFGGVPPNVYDETNCNPRTCKHIYWQECDPNKGSAGCPPNSTCSFGGNRAFCVPRACSKGNPGCAGVPSSLPEQCPRMPLYPVRNIDTLCFMTCDGVKARCPRGLACQLGICIFPIDPGIGSVSRTIH